MSPPPSAPQPAAHHRQAPIRVLPEATVSLIAAGEVIERPAAAVKELVENALDAGARRIAVSLADGGITRIEVTDDGCGMDAEALALAVQRHATSKLPEGDGLTRITTLGFRGEALPSIGAAARLAITSRPEGAAWAHLIRVEGERVTPPAPAAGPKGTQVVVADLFYATPARRKFLKHPRAEGEHAEAAVRRLAHAAPDVAFRLESDGRRVFDLPPQDRASRVAALLGVEAPLLAIEGGGEGLHVSGYAAGPATTRATASGQVLVVNGRPVADPVLRMAVRVAYRDVIAAGRHPIVALFLEIAHDALDVNVHPAKAELRFRDPGAVRALVIGAFRAALAAPASAHSATRLAARPPLRLGHLPGRLNPPSLPAAGFAEAQLPLAAPPRARSFGESVAGPSAFPLGAPVAQVWQTYIIAVAADGCLVLVDQHAAHERLMHEALKGQYVAGGVRSQPLLLPAIVDLPRADAARLLDHAAGLTRLGLEIEPFGAGAVLVRGLPAVLGAPEPGPLLRDLAEELSEGGEALSLGSRLDAILARLACHGSIRAGRALTQAEMAALLREMESTPRAATCSHGRPTYLKLSRAEVERLFQRR
ncbi:MAG: DNA mismatch repair endonuclease MutL [Acetobacteraceae bacterium]|nr:DNA mismatch repair endonuclease MutL [Acetobacteraceae bacterium]